MTFRKRLHFEIVNTVLHANKIMSLKAPTLHLISPTLISPTRFGALTHHHQGLRISCCGTKHVVVYGYASSIQISRTAFMFFTHSL
jgi:hypothetical protein